MYEYFASFNGKSKGLGYTLGNLIVKRNAKIRGASDIRELEKDILKNDKQLKEVCILNFQLLSGDDVSKENQELKEYIRWLHEEIGALYEKESLDYNDTLYIKADFIGALWFDILDKDILGENE